MRAEPVFFPSSHQILTTCSSVSRLRFETVELVFSQGANVFAVAVSSWWACWGPFVASCGHRGGGAALQGVGMHVHGWFVWLWAEGSVRVGTGGRGGVQHCCR